MTLDLSLGDSGGAASDPPASDPVEAVVESTDVAEETQADIELADDTKSDDEPETPAELSEEELEKLVKDENTPKEWRERLEKAWAVAGKRKEAAAMLQTEFDTYKQQFENKPVLEEPELQRLRTAEERQLKYTSFTAKPDELLAQLREDNPRAYPEVLKKAVWDAVEKPDGTPDFDNLQVMVDRFAAQFPGENPVAAKDVLQAMRALKEGTIEPFDLRIFNSVEEQESFNRAQQSDREAQTAREQAKANQDFTEKQVRSTFVNQEHHSIVSRFRGTVEKTMDTFKLKPMEGEPKIASDFKQTLNNELGLFIQAETGRNAALREVDGILTKLTDAAGLNAQEIQTEVQGVLNSPGYKLYLDKGLAEVSASAEKFLNQKALQYKYMMMGYEAETKKNPRAVPKAPNQAPNMESITEDDLKRMTKAERKDYEAQRFTREIREQMAA